METRYLDLTKYNVNSYFLKSCTQQPWKNYTFFLNQKNHADVHYAHLDR